MIKIILAISCIFLSNHLAAMKQPYKNMYLQPNQPIEHFARLASEEGVINKMVNNLQSMQDPKLAELKNRLVSLEKQFPTELEWINDVHEHLLNNLVAKFGYRSEILNLSLQLKSPGARRWFQNNHKKPNWH